MNKGFTIVCNNCGVEIQLNQTNDFKILVTAEREYDRNVVVIECDCGNEQTSDYD